MRTRLLTIIAVLWLCGGSLAPASDRPGGGTSAEALRVARESLSQWSLGRLTIRPRQQKPARVRAELLYRGKVVAKLRVDPRTGGFLAKDQRPEWSAETPDLPSLRAAVEEAMRHLEIGTWAWPKEHGRAWGVPLKYQGRVVERIVVSDKSGPLPVEDDDDDD